MRNLNGTDLGLDPLTGDIAFEDGDLVLIEGVDAVAQTLKQRLSFGLGEWFLSINKGVPYFQTILVKNPNIAAIEGIFRNTILSTPGVLELLSLDFDFDSRNRVFEVNFEARSQQGNINFSEIIGV